MKSIKMESDEIRIHFVQEQQDLLRYQINSVHSVKRMTHLSSNRLFSILQPGHNYPPFFLSPCICTLHLARPEFDR